MSIEGISTTSVASIIIAALGISIAAFLGATFLKPMFENHVLVSSIAYDIASMYDIAYTMPGEVSLNYYGPSACEWNHNLDGDSLTSFSCYGGNNVLLEGIYVKQEYIYLYNDPYMKYDEENVDSKYVLPAGSIYYPRPMSLSVQIPFFDSQYDYFNDELGQYNYGSFSKAIASASFTDIDLLVGDEESEVVVQDYSIVISKHNVEDYYYTLSSNPQNNLDSLSKLLTLIGGELINPICNDNNPYPEDEEYFVYNNGQGDFSQNVNVDSELQENFVNLVKGYRWQIYEDTIICQERLSVDKDSGVLINGSSYDYYDTEINGMKLNDYTVEYCFDISAIDGVCDNIKNVIFSNDFINYVNNEYLYYASFSSCLKPFVSYDEESKILTIDGVNARYNVIAGRCENED